MTHTSHTRYVIRYTDFGQPAEIPVPQKFSTVEAAALTASVGGTLHRITVTDEPVQLDGTPRT